MYLAEPHLVSIIVTYWSSVYIRKESIQVYIIQHQYIVGR